MVIFCHRFGVVVEAKIVMDSGLVRWYLLKRGSQGRCKGDDGDFRCVGYGQICSNCRRIASHLDNGGASTGGFYFRGKKRRTCETLSYRGLMYMYRSEFCSRDPDDYRHIAR